MMVCGRVFPFGVENVISFNALTHLLHVGVVLHKHAQSLVAHYVLLLHGACLQEHRRCFQSLQGEEAMRSQKAVQRANTSCAPSRTQIASVCLILFCNTASYMSACVFTI